MKNKYINTRNAQVNYIGMDDKCKVALGIAAATKQTQILMRTEARVRLPDHDLVVADRHKLNPSVISLHDVTPNEFVDPASV